MIAGISALKAILPPDPLVLDVGACKGEFTAALLEAIPKAKAILFEPTKTNARKLLERFHDNPRVKILECALGNLEGDGVFHRYAESETNSLLNLLSATSVSEQYHVRVETIDGVLRRNVSIGKLDLIKIDTQGTDLRVLKGAEKANRTTSSRNFYRSDLYPPLPRAGFLFRPVRIHEPSPISPYRIFQRPLHAR